MCVLRISVPSINSWWARERSSLNPSATQSAIAPAMLTAPVATQRGRCREGRDSSGSNRFRWPAVALSRRSSADPRRNPWSLMDFLPKRAARSSAVMPAASGPSLSIGGLVSTSPAATHQIPGATFLSLFGQEQGGVVEAAVRALDWLKYEACLPSSWFAERLPSATRRPPLHEMHDKRDRFEVDQEILASSAQHRAAAKPSASSGAGTAVLSAVKLNG